MSVLGTRSTSFSFGQPPAKQPFNFGGTAGGSGAAAPNTTPTGGQQTNLQQTSIPTFTFAGPSPTTSTAGQSLFGNANNAPKSGGFSFGQPQITQQQQFNNQQQPSTSLFGGFGQQASQAQTIQQPLGGGGLFGTSNNQNTAPGNSLFGNAGLQQSQPQQQQSGISLGGSAQPFSFGQSQQALGSQSAAQIHFGQSQQHQQLLQQPPVQVSSSSPFAKQAYFQKERFNELPEDSRKLLEELDSHINSQIRLKDELASKDFGTEIQKRRSEWHELQCSLDNSSAILEQDAELIRGVVDRVERDRGDFVSLFEIANNFKEGKNDGKQWVNWPGEFFAKAAAEFKERITRYRSTMEEIGKQLSTIDNRNNHSPELISNVIVNQHSTFMSLASNVATLHSEIDQLKKDYTQWYQQQHRSVQDPFAMSQLTSTF